MLDEASEEVRVIKNHPVQFLSLEEQVLYLQGLSLVMNANDVIVPEQKAYLLLLIRSWELDDSIMEELIHFCQQPNKEIIVSFFNTFKNHENKQNFIFDALTMLDISEQREPLVIQLEAIEKIAESFDIIELDWVIEMLTVLAFLMGEYSEDLPSILKRPELADMSDEELQELESSLPEDEFSYLLKIDKVDKKQFLYLMDNFIAS